jgi:hypothetical protein
MTGSVSPASARVRASARGTSVSGVSPPHAAKARTASIDQSLTRIVQLPCFIGSAYAIDAM